MNASDQLVYQGKIFDRLTLQIIHTGDRLLGLPKFGDEEEPVTWTQGSFRPYTSYSGPTHRGCGAGDATDYNWMNRVIIWDLLGMVAFHRSPNQGNWPYHVHCVVNGFGCVDPYAKGQILSAKSGHNGLKGNGPDPDKHLRSGLWPLAVFGGRTGPIHAERATTLYDGPSSKRVKLRAVPLGTKVNAIMEVRNLNDNIWFVTEEGEWGHSAKWAA